jgi:hypothetical protein
MDSVTPPLPITNTTSVNLNISCPHPTELVRKSPHLWLKRLLIVWNNTGVYKEGIYLEYEVKHSLSCICLMH